ncbi:hypothetical protein QL285_031635 [Trifolium repens]|jgi:hypothetical protein|nr:hypothetical protein QL285_031635 [Trifolium repens]
MSFVKETWENLSIQGKKEFIIKEKFKRLKESLKKWNKEVFGIIDLNINKTVKDLNEVEDLLANRTDDSALNTKDLAKQLWEQLYFKESLIQQKSRSKWIQEGDSNTRYFHARLKGRRRRNQIVSLKKGDNWIQGVDNIKTEATNHFSTLLSEEWENRPFL